PTTEATVVPTTVPTSEPAEPTATPAAQTLRVVVRLPDGTLQIVDTGFPAGGVRLDQGLLPLGGGGAGNTAYVLNSTDTLTAQRVDAAGATPLPFVENPSYGLAVWQGASPADLRLAWATSLGGDPAT